jgi:hypothetical protein
MSAAPRSSPQHPLAQNHRHIVELTAIHPGAAQHSLVLGVPRSSHGPTREEEVLLALTARHDALRLRVLPSLDEAAVLDPPDHLNRPRVATVDEAADVARRFLAEPLQLTESAAAVFQVIEVADGPTGHVVVAKASHLGSDATSRFLWLSEREALLADPRVVLPPTQQWTAYRQWETTHAVVGEPSHLVHDLGRPPWELGSRAGDHVGMLLGVIHRADHPSVAGLRGFAAVAWFAAAFVALAQEAKLATAPVVAIPMSFRRETGVERAVGDFVDHLVVAAPPGEHSSPAAMEDVLRRQYAQPVPLRVRLAPLGADRWRDPAPLTQAVLSFQPSSAAAPPFLLNLPGEVGDVALHRGESFLPVFVPVTPLERQDIALICSIYRGELRWRLSVRVGLGVAERLPELEERLERIVARLADRGGS